MLSYVDYAKIFISILAIVNPFGAIPIFIGLTSGMNRLERHKIADNVATGIAVILLVVLFFGELILEFFGITIDSFKVGGGILVLLMAISMLHAKTSNVRQTAEEASELEEKESIAIVPLAMPLLAGPGAISTVILAGHKGHGVMHYGMIAVSILFLSLFICSLLRLSPLIVTRLGATGLNIVTRIMGLMLAAIAIEFIANGMRGLFPALG